MRRTGIIWVWVCLLWTFQALPNGVSTACVHALTEPFQVEARAVANTDRRVLVYYPSPRGKRLIAVLHVMDPNGLFSGVNDSGFSLTLTNRTLMERLLFLHDRLRRRFQHVKVSFDGFETEITYLDRSRTWTEEEPTDLFLHFEGRQLAAEPNLLLASLIHQVMMDELRRLYPGTIETLIAETYRAKVSAVGPVPVEKIFELLRLRTSWHLTTEFYAACVPRVRSAHSPEFFRREFGAGILESSFEFFEKARLYSERAQWDELDAYLKAEFERFYDIDTSLVEALWGMPLPGGWEFSLAAPPMGVN